MVHTDTSGVVSTIEVSGHTYHFVKMTIEIDILAFTVLLQHGRKVWCSLGPSVNLDLRMAD